EAAETGTEPRKKAASNGPKETLPFQAVLEAAEAAEGELPFEAGFKAVEAVEAAVEFAAAEAPETRLKSGAEAGAGPRMRPATAVLSMRRATRTHYAG